jgi:protein ImuB
MFAVLLLPNFRLQAALRFREELSGKPVALVDGTEVKAGLLECNERAAASGVERGQQPSQALARCAQLSILSRAPAQEATVQTMLLETATAFSPYVEATAPGYCTLDLQHARASNWPELAGKIVTQLQALSLAASVGLAPNPDLAFLAARQARPVLVVQTPETFLASLAVQELEPAPELLAVLGDWGIHNLAQLTSLPRGELMDRLGLEAARLWERAAGQSERPLRFIQPVEQFSESYEFEHEVETVEPLLFLLRRFLDQLSLRLGQAYRVAGAMLFTMELAEGQRYERQFTVPAPTAEVEVLFRILQTHLDGLQLARPIVALALAITPAHAERQQFQLFESPLRDPNRFGETLGRLAALVGAENVGVPVVEDTHRPDRFRLLAPQFHEMKNVEPPFADHSIGLPLRRYRPAVAVEVRLVRQCPVFLRSAAFSEPVVEALGPYRASGNWWETAGWAREEWDVELTNGGLYRLAGAEGGWWIEGSYNEPPPATSWDKSVVPMNPFLTLS